MPTNQAPPAMRSSGHKDATEDHQTVSAMNNMGPDNMFDPEDVLNKRILSHDAVDRAALYDESDFLCLASSVAHFNVEPDDVRKILDGLLTYARQDDPTVAGGAGQPPAHLSVGADGRADVKAGDDDKIVAELNGKPFIAARTAKYVLLTEGKEGANVDVLSTVVQSFQAGLQTIAL
ncbi:hypothetical protein Q5752_001050 [Cryptotrichosporon argae]